jgi:predicted TIM-barrel fold metal-dependent hydrolase
MRQCGEAGLPVVFHLTDKFGWPYGLVDEMHMPGLERLLKQVPDTMFLGHAPAFWSEISGDVTDDERGGYPSGKISREGRLQTLLDTCPNLYGDLSAGSGFNALNRDPEYAFTFLEKYQDRMLFATDYLREGQEVPIVDFIKHIGLSPSAFEKITHGNAQKLLGIA